MNTRPPSPIPYAEARERMVREQLRSRGITDRAVLLAMGRVPREWFVESGQEEFAYDDRALPIACGQAISQPYMVAAMTQALELSPGMKVLEIGTGSGYQAAVLAEMSAEVYSVERHTELSERAWRRLNPLGYGGVHLRVGDGNRGWPAESPFDRILLTAASAECPPLLLSQLAESGRLLGPFGGPRQQELRLLTRNPDGIQTTSYFPCRFVPLISAPPAPLPSESSQWR